MFGGNKKLWVPLRPGGVIGVRRRADIGGHHRLVSMNLFHLKRNSLDIRAPEPLDRIGNTDQRFIFASGYEGLQARSDFPCLADLKVAWIGKLKRSVRGGEGRGLMGRYLLLAVRHLRQPSDSRQHHQDSRRSVHKLNFKPRARYAVGLVRSNCSTVENRRGC